MKRLLVLVALFALAFPATANAEVESNGQLLITVGRTFSPFTITETSTGGLYAHATGLVSVRGDAMLFGYFGPEFSFATQTNLKILSGVWMTKDGGMSAIASLWLNQPLPSDLNVFLEGDAYFPIDGANGHSQRSYYTFLSLDWMPKENVVGLGLVQENFFSEHSFDEAAVGPALIFDKGRLWLFYDLSPDIPGSVLGLRLCLNL